jgi:hypothetical protein
MNEEGKATIREEPAIRFMSSSDEKYIGEFSDEVARALQVHTPSASHPMSKRALIDGLALAAALDAGYIKAEEVIGMLQGRISAALIGAAQRIVSEGDRKRGEMMALRGIKDSITEQIFGSTTAVGQWKVVEAPTPTAGRVKRKATKRRK